MPPSEPSQIKTLPELSRKALLAHQDLRLRLWYLGGYQDTLEAQSGARDGKTLRADVLALTKRVGLPERSTKELLRQGEGLFWRTAGPWLYLVSQEKLAYALGCEEGPGRGVYVPLQEFAGRESYRAYLYATWIRGHAGGVIISRARLKELFGRSPPTLRRWERVAGVQVIEQKAQAPVRTLDDSLPVMGAYPDASRTRREVIDGEECEVWQISSHYSVSHLAVARKGMSAKIRRKCRRALGCPESPRRHQRLYFDNPSEAIRAMRTGQAVFLKIGMRRGRMRYALNIVG